MTTNKNYKSYDQLKEFLGNLDTNPLSREDERALILKYQSSGDRKALNKLISSHQKFVARVAFKFLHSNLPLEDLMVEGSLGLVKAIKKFDVSSDYRLLSYGVWWIRQSISRAVADHATTLKQSIKSMKKVPSLKSKDVKWSQYIGGKFWYDEKDLKDKCGFDKDTLNELFSYQEGLVSFDSPLGDGDNSIKDLVSNDGEEEIFDQMEQKEKKNLVERLLKSLSPRHREIIKTLYGLDSADNRTLTYVGKKSTLSRERIRQLRNQALKAMKTASFYENLE